jgi:hypothetical protein
MENGVIKKKEHFGFSMMDESVMSIIALATKIKLESL